MNIKEGKKKNANGLGAVTQSEIHTHTQTRCGEIKYQVRVMPPDSARRFLERTEWNKQCVEGATISSLHGKHTSYNLCHSSSEIDIRSFHSASTWQGLPRTPRAYHCEYGLWRNWEGVIVSHSKYTTRPRTRSSFSIHFGVTLGVVAEEFVDVPSASRSLGLCARIAAMSASLY